MEVFFSALTRDFGGSKNPLYSIYERLKAEGQEVVDLVCGNVNEHGIVYPPDALDEILSQAAGAARIYRPDSLGQRSAREAIAEYYGNLNISPERILLTPGTSVSYWYCFKLLAEAGDEILCPEPSYPLFDYIVALCGVQMKHYRLNESGSWHIDISHLKNQITASTRAIVLISPHNPTGMVASFDELSELAQIATEHSLAIISDEVFSEFLFGQDTFPRAANTPAPLVFTLNGLSKMFALPGIKIGWMAVTGDDVLVRKALSALELISDTFLPVNEIAQFAVPEIFRQGREFLKNYQSWIQMCRSSALDGLQGCSFVPPEGGFYITVRTDADEEYVAKALLEEDKILVHPGYFYDIEPNHLVMTFVDNPASIREHFETIGRRLH